MTILVEKRAHSLLISLFVAVLVILNSPVAWSQKSDSTHKVIWGSASSPFRGEKDMDGLASWKRLNDKIKSLNGGYGLQGRRSYDRAIPASFAESAMGPDIDLCHVSIGSFKPSWKATADGSNREAMKQFIQSIPDNHEVYLVFHHEPEDEALSGRSAYSPELLQEAFARFVEVVLASGKPNVHPCFVLMSWTFNPKSRRNTDSFNLGAKLNAVQKSQVIAGVDGYADVPATASAKVVFESSLAKMASWGFKRFGIFETATHGVETQPGRAEWIRDLGEWANNRKDIELVCWFHSGVGQHSGEKGWYLGQWSVNSDGTYRFTDLDGSLAAYGQLIRP